MAEALNKKLFPDKTIRRLDVVIHHGCNLTNKGSKMNPFVRLQVTKPWHEGRTSFDKLDTTTIQGTKNPEWEEEFSFLISTNNGPGKLKLLIFDSQEDNNELHVVSTVDVDLSHYKEGQPYEKHFFSVDSNGQLEVSLRIRMPTADVRFGTDVNHTEKHLAGKRRENTETCIRQLLTINEEVKVPSIAVVTSGGGMRAMVGTSGAVRALREEGLLDCCIYMSSLSGSTWYLSLLYLLDTFPDVDQCTDYIRKRCSETHRCTHEIVWKGIEELAKKKAANMNFSILDFWGYLLQELLDPEVKKLSLSDAASAVATCQLPFPIFTAASVSKDDPLDLDSEWMEFTPFEYGIHRCKLFAPTKDIASDRGQGIVSRRLPEPKVAFMQGMWGSAFGATIGDLLATEAGNLMPKSHIEDIISELLPEKTEADGIDVSLEELGLRNLRPLAGSLPNYMNGIPADVVPEPPRRNCCTNVLCRYLCCLCTCVFCRDRCCVGVPEDIRKEGRLTVVDAGTEFNLPFPPVLRPERHTDVFLVFDYSWRQSQDENPFQEIRKAKSWADRNGYKFPSIPEKPHDIRECYVFEEADCPTIIFFNLCNVERRKTDIEGQDQSYRNVDPFSKVYSTTNFSYSTDDFGRLHELCYFNTGLGIKDVKEAIKKKLTST